MLWLGIDFSGDFTRWGEHHLNSNVWVATMATVEGGVGFALTDLRRVQCLDGQGPPFSRLVSLLQGGDYRAAAIDAPFSVPADYVPAGGHNALLEVVANIKHPDRPFPNGASLVQAVTHQNPPLNPQPRRLTEQLWRDRGLAVRSTLWNGARPGAPMTAACLKLLSCAGRPIWPWQDSDTPGLLVEGFPAAQLCQWGWPFKGYNGDGPVNIGVRACIVQRLEQERGVTIPGNFWNQLLASADAVDALLCAFAAAAVTEARLPSPPDPAAKSEGWIAVCS